MALPCHARLILAFALSAVAFRLRADQEFPNVVILDSYHPGFQWSDKVLKGLLDRLGEKYPRIDPAIEYLDAKRFPGAERLELAEQYVSRKYRGSKVDLVVTLDNPAFDVLLRHRREFFPDVPVVFAGYNNYNPSLLEGHTKVTGVAEEENIAGNLQLALSLLPNTRRVLFLNDETATGFAVRRKAETIIPSFSGRIEFDFLPPSTYGEAAAAIQKLPHDAFAFILAFATDREGHSPSTSESTEILTADAPVPVFTPIETRLGYGVVGGFLLTGNEHGRRAGDLALRVLAGEDPSRIAVVTESTSVPIFDYRRLIRFKIPLSALPAGSVVIHRPQTLLEKYGTIALAVLGIIVLLTAMIVVLSAAIVRRRIAERELGKSESRLRVLLNSTSDLIIATDTARLIQACNPAITQFLGYTPQEVIGRSAEMLHVSAEGFKRFGEVAFPILARDGFWRGEWKYRAKDGSAVDVEIVLSEQKTEGSALLGYVGVMRDIRERKRAEEALRRTEEKLTQAQKMEVVGKLAGGIAHDFNNLLTVIRGYGDFAVEKMAAGDPMRADLLEIKKAAERATLLTAQLLAFSRKQIFQTKVFNLSILVSEMTKMLQRLIGEDVELLTELEPGLANIKADPGQIEQVIMNLVLNARDAMPRGGRLILKTAEADLGEDFVREHPEAKAGRYVVLTVRDTGHGMDRETLSHLFEPFFTTKEKGRGTGLGLSTVYGIVKQSGGQVFCESTQGEGTVFTIHLPRTEAGDAEEAPPSGKNETGGGRERILLVEDEAAVRGLVKSALTQRGYSVRETSNGKEAMELVSGVNEPYDLVITDVIMPRMSGKELVEKIRKARPGIRVLFISGYVGGSIEPEHGVNDGEPLIQKPFSPADLVKKVRSILDGA